MLDVDLKGAHGRPFSAKAKKEYLKSIKQKNAVRLISSHIQPEKTPFSDNILKMRCSNSKVVDPYDDSEKFTKKYFFLMANKKDYRI